MKDNKKVVIALGGNALGNNYQEQEVAVVNTASVIADLIEEGFEVVITHGNGPQVGMIHTAMTDLENNYDFYKSTPMAVCVAMSQGYIGYSLQKAVRTELKNRGINKAVASILTQVKVNSNDEGFKNPSKPIGRFLTKEESMVEEGKKNPCIEDAGRGFRRVVASPKPVDIVEIDTIKTLVDVGQVVIACGGGGIPVTEDDKNHLQGEEAVIDKDFASALLAEELEADYLIILTAVEKVAINYGKENQQWLSKITIEEAEEYIKQEQFAPGSMLPKVEAAIKFASSGNGRHALITLLDKAKDGILGNTGTVISK